MFGGLLVLALATDNTAITDGLAMVFLGARVLQTLVHIASTSILAVQARFFFFLAQLIVSGIWLFQFVGVALN